MTRQIWLPIILLIMSVNIHSQKMYTIRDFSDKYYAKLYNADSEKATTPSWVALYEKASDKEILKLEVEQLYLNLHDGEVVANIVELPYGEHSVLIYDDFNFDGIEDVAIMDGHNSCYGGSSFQVFLATKEGFEWSEAFTRLAQEYCGMFSIDPEKRMLYTMTKSGCCWHQFSEYVVENNVPAPVKIVEEGMSANGASCHYEVQTRINGKMVDTSYDILDTQSMDEYTIFRSQFKNGKILRLLNYSESDLWYFFTDKDNKIELEYYDVFTYNKAENTLQFKNNNTTYTIYDKGIKVKTPSKEIDMKAEEGTVKGSLNDILKFDRSNVVKKE